MALPRLTLGTKMALLSFALVLLGVAVSTAVQVHRVTILMEREMGMRTIAIARTLAQMKAIQENVGRPGGDEVIQPIAEKTRLSTGVEYIVVVDMKGIRYSHPVEDRIGEKFSGRDLAPALANNEYITRAEGVLGNSVRAFTPVKVEEGNRQVGAVVVGVLTPTPAEVFELVRREIYFTLGVGLVVGLLGSLFLARNIKRAMFSLEPEEIVRLLKERVAIFEAMGEGIVAIDTSARITVMNDEARRIFGMTDSVDGEPVDRVIPGSRLPRVLKTGKPEKNRERIINGVTILSNRVPIRMDDKIVGAVATFRDKTEINRLAEELTGVKAFVEALRVQNHENMNKLHTIAGLIQLGRDQDALDYIFNITEEQQELTRFLTRNIQDYSLAGLLLGKYGRAKELRVELLIDRESYLEELPTRVDTGSLVVIVGNLLENALDAVSGQEERRQVHFLIQGDREGIRLEVRDTGPGVPPEIRDKIFREGFTTKGGRSRGLGLFLVRKNVDRLEGELEMDFGEEGTVFRVRIAGGQSPGISPGRPGINDRE